MSAIRLKLVIAGVAVSMAWTVLAAEAPSKGAGAMKDHPLAAALTGHWTGEGTVSGNPVTLERAWETALGDQFLTAQMTVRMSNGRSFRALLWVKPLEGRELECLWLDESGKLERHSGLKDPDGKSFAFQYLETEGDPDATGWRRVTFRVLAPDAYEEQVHVEKSGAWEKLAHFTFARTKE